MKDIIVNCPHCGAAKNITDHAPWNLEEAEEYDCEECGKQFEVEAEYKFIRHHVVCPECGEWSMDCLCDMEKQE